MAEALYRKYRPQVFEDVVGQEHIERTLKNAIDQGKVSHAYLFCGPRGTGKTTTARLLAKALLCEKGPTSSPDGTCRECVDVANGVHPDVYELDAASRTGVENVREEIIGRVNFAPARGGRKVYIIDEVHMLSTAAFNALLKTLEEPPAHVVFVLCTTDPQKVPATIHSRCQRFDFHRLGVEQIAQRLEAVCTAEGARFEEGALTLVARRAEGGMRNALTTLEQLIAFGEGLVSVQGAEDLLGSLDSADMDRIIGAIGRRDVASCFRWTADFVASGADLAQFARDMAERVRNIYVMGIAGSGAYIQVTDAERRQLESDLALFGPDRASRMLCVLGDLISELKTAGNPRLCFEIALTRMVRPDSDLTLESLAERIEALEEGKSAVAMYVAPAAPSQPAAAAIPMASADSVGAGNAQPAPAPVPPAPVSATVPEPSVRAVASAPVETPAPAPVPPAPRVAAELPAPAPCAPAAAPVSEAKPVAPQQPAAVQPAAAQSASAAPSGDLASITSNPAALQRVWRSVVAAVKKEKVSYGVLFVNVKVKAAQDGQGVSIEFPSDNPFAFTMANRPEVQEMLSRAFAQVAGMQVPFTCVQAGAASKPSVPSVPMPAAPAAASPVVAAPAYEPPSRPSAPQNVVAQVETPSAARQSEPVAPEPSWQPPVETQAAPADDTVPVDAYDGFAGYDDYDYGYGADSYAPASSPIPPAARANEAQGDSASADDLSKMLSGTMGVNIVFEEVDD